MRKFTQRVLITGAAEMAIIGAVGGVNLLAEAQADPATCVSATGLCQPEQITGPHLRGRSFASQSGRRPGLVAARLRHTPPEASVLIRIRTAYWAGRQRISAEMRTASCANRPRRESDT